MFDQLFKFIAWLLSALYSLVGSYGLAIVLLTLIVMAVTTPLTIKGTKSMMQMQRLQPELKKIQERNRDDREKMNQELLAFYKEHNINPVGGCLPMFIQLPVFAVLYRVLRGLTERVTNIGLQSGSLTAQLRDALPFSKVDQPDRNFKPGYISKNSELYKSLSKTHEMKSWGIDLADSASSALSKSIGHSIPYLILIAIVAVTGIYQQRQIQGRSSSSAPVNSQQQAIMKIMPFFLPVISFGLPAGLVLYFVVSNLWRVGQQAFITKTLYGTAHAHGVVETTAKVVAPVGASTVAEKSTTEPKPKPTKNTRSGEAGAERSGGTSVMGRNRRENAPQKPKRMPAPAAPKDTAPTSGRVTPSGSTTPGQPAKSKKKRK